jgi:hypothetical protein
MPRSQRLRTSRQAQAETPLRVDRMSELAGDTSGDERMHRAGSVEPTVRKLGLADSRLTHELAEVCFDTGDLLQAYEVRDYRHAPVLLIATPVEHHSMRWWAV